MTIRFKDTLLLLTLSLACFSVNLNAGDAQETFDPNVSLEELKNPEFIEKLKNEGRLDAVFSQVFPGYESFLNEEEKIYILQNMDSSRPYMHPCGCY